MPRKEKRESLALDVEALRRRLGPVKVALIEQWIREVNGPFDAVIAANMVPGALVLDMGCSRGDPDLPAMRQGRLLVGCDIDLRGLRANQIAGGCVAAPMHQLPFQDETFDLIVAKWVAEHLPAPRHDFLECHRVLKQGGVFVLLTPNAWSPFTWLSRVVPYAAKRVFKHHVLGVHEEDTFRTWYRANTRRRLAWLGGQAGFQEMAFQLLPGMWTFFIFQRRLALTVRGLEHVAARLPGAAALTTHIIMVCQKRQGENEDGL